MISKLDWISTVGRSVGATHVLRRRKRFEFSFRVAIRSIATPDRGESSLAGSLIGNDWSCSVGGGCGKSTNQTNEKNDYIF